MTLLASSTDVVNAAATVTAAFGALVALLFTLWTYRRDLHARLHEERLQQAKSVSAWPGFLGERGRGPKKGQTWQRVELLNASNEPVYRVIGFLTALASESPDLNISGPAEGPSCFASILPPGRFRIDVAPDLGDLNKRGVGVELAFTDRSGNHWLRRANGRLEPIEQYSASHYRCAEPLPWEVPRPHHDD